MPQGKPKTEEEKREGYFRKHLYGLKISTNNIFAIKFFQNGWNTLVLFGTIQGPILDVNNSPDDPTLQALKFAVQFQASKPKSWIYYVKKAEALNG